MVEVPRAMIKLLIAGRWLRPGECDDPVALLLAVKRVGFAPTVTWLS